MPVDEVRKPEAGDKVRLRCDVFARVANVESSSAGASGEIVSIDPMTGGACKVGFTVDKIYYEERLWSNQFALV